MSFEDFGTSALALSEEDMALELVSASPWDVAVRYHEFKAQKRANAALIRRMRAVSARVILERAQAILGSIVHPAQPEVAPWDALPPEAENLELELDETIEESLVAIKKSELLERSDLWMSYQRHRTQPVILSVDTSLSMTGEKLALTAVALAVVLLQFPEDPVGIVAFESEATVLKRPEERLSLQSLIERFLDVPAQGYTHLEDGLRLPLRMIHEASHKGGRPTSTLLLTDGKYTAGRDPGFLGSRFPHLVVLKMGTEKSSLALCQELAQKGHGLVKEVPTLEGLPTVMYSVVKDLLRGRAAR